MKENVKLKDIKVKDFQAQEKGVNFFDMWKAFWSPEPEETSEVETIMHDDVLSNEMKELLIKSLKNADKIVKPTDGGSSKGKRNLKVNAKESAKSALKDKPIEVKKENIEISDEVEKTRED